MKKGDYNLKTGFTIIEVSLVLGIAGLIFLMVFVALPTLQRQARNTSRQEDITDLVTAIKKYQTNNRGALPGAVADSGAIVYNESSTASANTWTGFLRDYMNNGFVDPATGDSYTLRVENCVANGKDQPCTNIADYVSNDFETNNFTMLVVKQAKCAGDESKGALMTSSPRKFAVLYRLEGSGLYCANS